MAFSDELETFICAELTQGRGIESVDPDVDLLALGIIDSHGIMEIVGFLEERYAVSIADDDLTPENFQTVSSIEAFVDRKREARR